MEKEHTILYMPQAIHDSNPLNILQLLANGDLHGSCCNKLVKHSLFSKYNIKFQEDIIRWEDLQIMMRIYMLSEVKTAYLNKAFYHYTFFLSQQSLAKNNSLQAIESQMSVIKSLEKEVEVKHLTVDFSEMKIATKMLAFKSNNYSFQQLISIYPEIDSRLRQSKSIARRLLSWELKFKCKIPFYVWKVGSMLKHL